MRNNIHIFDRNYEHLNQIEMKIRNFIYATMIAVAAVMFAGCEKATTDEGGENGGVTNVPTEDITFTLSVESVDKTSAKILVKHDGSTNASWLGFATEDLTTDLKTLIADKVAEYNGNVTGLKRQNELTARVSGLTPGTTYRYVVTGCLADGTVYGTPNASETFTTDVELDVNSFKVNPNWTVSYVGARESEDGKIYEHCIENNSTDQNTYLFSLVYAEGWDASYLPEVVEQEIEYMQEIIDYYGATWADAVYKGTDFTAYNLDPGSYIGLALGVDTNGNPTGWYAESEVFTIVEPDATPEFTAWLGTWDWTGANGVTFSLVFDKYINNEMIVATGWERLTQLGFAVTYNSDNTLSIIGQSIGQLSFQDGSTGAGYFLPLDAEGYFYPVQQEMCKITLNSAGNATAAASTLNLEYEDGTTDSVLVTGMTFIAQIGESYYGLSEEELPTFPATLTKTAEPQSLTAKKINTRFHALKLYYPMQKAN